MDRLAGDDTLMEAAGNGDEVAFALLMKRHWAWVYCLMRAMVRDHEQAQDLAQETFYRVYRHLGDYEGRERFVPWLKRIAVNVARNHLRDGRRARSLAAAPEEIDGAAAAHADPEALLSSHLLREEVRAALDTLSVDQRRVLALYYFDGMDVQAIARSLQCPAGTVKSRLFYARRGLRQALRASMNLPAEDPEKGDRSDER